jgi:hypothetical protein
MSGKSGTTRCEMANPVQEFKGALFYAGWHSMQLSLMIRVYAPHDKQQFVNDYLSSLRPEIVSCMTEDADDLFPPMVAGLVKNFKEEWHGSR